MADQHLRNRSGVVTFDDNWNNADVIFEEQCDCEIRHVGVLPGIFFNSIKIVNSSTVKITNIGARTLRGVNDGSLVTGLQCGGIDGDIDGQSRVHFATFSGNGTLDHRPPGWGQNPSGSIWKGKLDGQSRVWIDACTSFIMTDKIDGQSRLWFKPEIPQLRFSIINFDMINTWIGAANGDSEVYLPAAAAVNCKFEWGAKQIMGGYSYSPP